MDMLDVGYFDRFSGIDSLANVPHVFLDKNFNINDAETFGKIFPFLLDNSQAESLAEQIETHGRLTQEKLGHHLDAVEANIVDQVAQKSHHFFQVRLAIVNKQESK